MHELVARPVAARAHRHHRDRAQQADPPAAEVDHPWRHGAGLLSSRGGDERLRPRPRRITRVAEPEARPADLHAQLLADGRRQRRRFGLADPNRRRLPALAEGGDELSLQPLLQPGNRLTGALRGRLQRGRHGVRGVARQRLRYGQDRNHTENREEE